MPKRLSTFLRYLLMFLAFAPLIRVMIQKWDRIHQAFINLHWGTLIWALVALFLVMPFTTFISWISLRSLGVNVSAVKVFSIYFLSQVPKYLPGGVWAFPGRMLAYQLVGVRRTPSVISIFRELVVLFLGAVIVGWGGLSWESERLGLILPEGLLITILIGVVVCVGIIGLTQYWPVWQWLWTLPARLPLLKNHIQQWLFLSPEIMTDAERRQISNPLWLPVALICSILFWSALGIPFRQLVMAIDPTFQSVSWFQAASLFALAWSIGFAVVFVPAGMGIRESVLVLLLSHLDYITISSSDAISVALLSRLWWMAVEASWVVFSLFLWNEGRTLLLLK